MSDEKKVLIVDDSHTIRNQIKGYITGDQFIFYEAENGKVALDILSQNHDMALVFCDIHMPVMDGLEFLEHIQSLKIQVPIIIMTNESSAAIVERAKKLGIYGWIVKPATSHIVESVLAKIFKNS